MAPGFRCEGPCNETTQCTVCALDLWAGGMQYSRCRHRLPCMSCRTGSLFLDVLLLYLQMSEPKSQEREQEFNLSFPYTCDLASSLTIYLPSLPPGKQ